MPNAKYLDLNELRRKAEAGDADAQMKLGVIYDPSLWSRYVDNDLDEKLLETRKLYKCYKEPRSAVESSTWYKRASDQAHVHASYRLAVLYSNLFISKSKEPHMQHDMSREQLLQASYSPLKFAADQKFVPALNKLAHWYRIKSPILAPLAQHGVKFNPEHAASLYEQAFEKGSLKAGVALGEMQERGELGAINIPEAMRYYKLVIDTRSLNNSQDERVDVNITMAEENLAKIYEAQKNYQEAYVLYSRSYSSNNASKMKLFIAIDELLLKGDQMLQGDALSVQEGQKAKQLAVDLQNHALKFTTADLSTSEKKQSRDEFKNLLELGYKNITATHRAYWKPLLVNIVLAATGIGLLFITGYYLSHDKFPFFKTSRQNKVKDIKESLDTMFPPNLLIDPFANIDEVTDFVKSVTNEQSQHKFEV